MITQAASTSQIISKLKPKIEFYTKWIQNLKKTLLFLIQTEDILFKISPFFTEIIDYFTQDKTHKNKCLKMIHDLKNKITTCRQIALRSSNQDETELQISHQRVQEYEKFFNECEELR